MKRRNGNEEVIALRHFFGVSGCSNGSAGYRGENGDVFPMNKFPVKKLKIRLVSLVVITALMMSLALPIPQVSYAETLGGFVEDDFTRISEGGFGDPMNNYAWSMAYFCGDLYVGTVRNVLAFVLQLVGIPPTGIPLTRPKGELGDPGWAEDMTPQIWRYRRGKWEMVYEPDPVVIKKGEVEFPRTIGYRVMTTFTDKHGDEAIYAGVGIMSFAEPGQAPDLILRSDDGETWLPVNTESIVGTDIRAMVAHEGKLYVSGMGGVIYCTDDPQTLPEGIDTWTPVCDPFLGDPDNTEIPELASFCGRLYAGTYNAENGFQVWRSKNTHPESQDDWERIVEGGFGDTWSQGAITMEPFKDHLYVGSAIWLGYFPLIPGEGKGPKGFDLIRIDKDKNVELVVGSYYPRDPPPGEPEFRVPLSKWSAGFGNIANSYCWQLEEHCGYLYLGSFDWSLPIYLLTSLFDGDTLTSIIEELREMEIPEEYEPYMQELLEVLKEEPTEPIEKLVKRVVKCLVKHFGGGDLWKSPDGIHWIPVSLNGFDNPSNCGFRTIVSTPDDLFVGTANPFKGCEVWVETKGTVVSCGEDGDVKFQFYPNEDVYVKGKGFPPCKDVTIYVIPDGLDPEIGNAVTGSPDTTDEKGKLPPTLVWESPLDLGQYDVWVDVNQNLEYDGCDAYIERYIDVYLFMVV